MEAGWYVEELCLGRIYWSDVAKKENYAVFYLNFHGLGPNAHFEEIRTSNTHNSFMVTEFLPLWSMILPVWDWGTGG